MGKDAAEMCTTDRTFVQRIFGLSGTDLPKKHPKNEIPWFRCRNLGLVIA